MSTRKIVEHIAAARGVHVLKASEADQETRFRLAMPTVCCDLDLRERLLMTPRERAVEMIDCEVTGAQRRMFHTAREHIAKHDRDPLDRLKQIEAAGRALLEALGPVGFGRADSSLTKAALDLEQLLRAKPGAASWNRDGYGKDAAR